MRLKNIDFNQPIRFLINNKPYTFSSEFKGRQKLFNKGIINYKQVAELDGKNQFLIFPKFSRVEHYYGNELFFLGFIKEQSGTAHPDHIKSVDIVVLDGKDWLTQSETIDSVFIDKTYQEVVEFLINKINLPFIKAGVLEFPPNGKIEAWDSNEADAYSVLRFIEKQSGSLLQILLESDKTYSVNFFNKSDIINKNPKHQGINLEIETKEKFKIFNERYKLLDIKWRQIDHKNFNIVRVTSEKVVAKIATTLTIDLMIVDETYILPSNLGVIDDQHSYFLSDTKKQIRRLKIITQADADKGRSYDVAYTSKTNTITISSKLTKKRNYLQFSYYELRKGNVQVENKADQNKVAVYTQSTGKKSRFEKHNDAGVIDHLIKYANHYLELGAENKLELLIKTEKAIWDVGEHCNVKHFYNQLDGIYYVKAVAVNFINYKDGVIVEAYEYILSKSIDFEDNINFYDNQSYRQHPIYQKERQDSFFNASFDVSIVGEPAFIFCVTESKISGDLQSELQSPLGQATITDETTSELSQQLQGSLFDMKEIETVEY